MNDLENQGRFPTKIWLSTDISRDISRAMANWSALNAQSTLETRKRKRVEGATQERPHGAAGEQKGDSGDKEQNDDAQDENDKSSAENEDGGQGDDRLYRPDVDTGDEYCPPLKKGSGQDLVSGKENPALGNPAPADDASQGRNETPDERLRTPRSARNVVDDEEDTTGQRRLSNRKRFPTQKLEESSERRKTLEPNQPSMVRRILNLYVISKASTLLTLRNAHRDQAVNVGHRLIAHPMKLAVSKKPSYIRHAHPPKIQLTRQQRLYVFQSRPRRRQSFPIMRALLMRLSSNLNLRTDDVKTAWLVQQPNGDRLAETLQLH